MIRAATRPSASRTSVVGVAWIGVFSANASLIAGVLVCDRARVGHAVRLGEGRGRLGGVDGVDAEECDILAGELRVGLLEVGRLGATRTARGVPEVHDQHVAEIALARDVGPRLRGRCELHRLTALVRRDLDARGSPPRCSPCCRPRGTARRAGRSSRRRARTAKTPASATAEARRVRMPRITPPPRPRHRPSRRVPHSRSRATRLRRARSWSRSTVRTAGDAGRGASADPRPRGGSPRWGADG